MPLYKVGTQRRKRELDKKGPIQGDDVDLYDGHVGHPQRFIGVKISLVDDAIGQGDLVA
jgi:hypothetical protein